jgi:dTDP-4-amino-4,6-dideoxygalactose transaminase
LRDHGAHPRYYHHEVGINSRLDAIQAAMLLVKLPHLDAWATARARHAHRYNEAFAKQSGLTIPQIDAGVTTVWNQYTVRVPGGRRDALRDHLAHRKIGCSVYYPVPLHLQKCFASLGGKLGDLPHTEQAANEVLSLPVYPELTHIEQNLVIDEVTTFYNGATARAA